MNYIKLTQIGKFEAHDDCKECRDSLLKQNCKKHLEELESLKAMVYDFLLETIRLENFEDQDSRIEIGDMLYRVKFIVRINKMMLHRAALYHPFWIGADLDAIATNFHYMSFILEIFNERLKELEADVKYKWAAEGLGINPHKPK